MIQFFLVLYHFFRKQKVFLYLLLTLLTASLLYFASQIRFVEDINSFMPKIDKSEYIGKVFKQIKIKDKIVVIISGKDSTQQAEPEQMIAAGKSFLDSLRSSPIGQSHIKSVMYEINDTIADLLLHYTLDHLPIFLDSVDYIRLDSLLIPENMGKRMKQNYANLLSPLSIVSKKVIFSDPLGISGNSLKNLGDLQLNMQYELFGDHIFSADHHYLLAVISPRYGAGEISNNEPFVREIEHRIDQLTKQYPGIGVTYFGGIPISVYNARQIKADSLLTMIITLSVITLVILLAFRRKSAIPLIVLPVLFGGIFALAAVFLIQGSISSIAVGAGSAVLGIAFSYSIHVFCHSLHTQSAEQIISELAYPMTIGSFTTIGGFAGLTFSSSEILYDFGLFSCFTLIGTTLFCLVFLPHFLIFKQQKESRFMRWIEKINAYSFEKNKYLIIFIVIVTGLCLYFFNDVRFNTDMMKLSFNPEKFVRAENILMNTFQDEYKSVSFVSVGDNRDETLQNYRKASVQLEKLRQQGLIKEFSSATHLLIPEEEQERRIRMWDDYWTPEKKDSLKKNLQEAGNKYKFVPSAFQDFFVRMDKKYQPVDYGNPDFEGSRLLGEWIEASGNLTMAISQVRLSEANKDKVYDTFRHSGNMVILDKPYFANQMAEVVNNDFNTILYIVSFLVFFSILVSYGRIEITLITFLPMAISWIIILGIMAMFGIEFNIVNIIISTFIFGIGDDFSIFITDGLLSEYKTGKKMLNAHKTAIFFSAFTVITGLGAMIFSRHPALYSVSVTSIIGMIAVVLISYTIQPLIFRLLISGRTARGRFPHTWSSLLLTIIALGIFATGSILLTILSYLFIILPFSKKRKEYLYHYLIFWFAGFLLWVMANTKKVRENPSKEKFKKPAIIIANHQSVIDIIQLLALHPKLIMVTKSWVTHSFLFGRVAHYAGFIDITEGYEQSEIWMKKQMDEGYSIAVFPEGSRSADCKIRRFHKGAFLLAERLQADIIPVLLHGNGQVISKDDPFYMKNGVLALKILPRITYEKSSHFGTSYQEKVKGISRMFREEHAKFAEKADARNPFYRYQLIKNYTYKGPVLEWYLRIKVAMETDYKPFEEWIPKQAKITDIGCGYGFLAYMLAFRSDQRFITGIDYDEEKIVVANRNFSHNDQLKFIVADASQITPESADVFILNDMLHYMTKEKQNALLKQCVNKLNHNGMIILRDGDRDQEKKHDLTRLSEVFSTQIIRFNKKEEELRFISTQEMVTFAKSNGLLLITIENDKYSSNTIYIMQKNKTSDEPI